MMTLDTKIFRAVSRCAQLIDPEYKTKGIESEFCFMLERFLIDIINRNNLNRKKVNV